MQHITSQRPNLFLFLIICIRGNETEHVRQRPVCFIGEILHVARHLDCDVEAPVEGQVAAQDDDLNHWGGAFAFVSDNPEFRVEVGLLAQAYGKDTILQEGIDWSDVLGQFDAVSIAEDGDVIAALADGFQQKEWVLGCTAVQVLQHAQGTGTPRSASISRE